MTKAFDAIYAGLTEALAYAEGKADASKYKVHVPKKIDVKALRSSMSLTQDEFARVFHLTAARVKDWEQGRSAPDGAVRAYLTVIRQEPAAVVRALRMKPFGNKASLRTGKPVRVAKPKRRILAHAK